MKRLVLFPFLLLPLGTLSAQTVVDSPSHNHHKSHPSSHSHHHGPQAVTVPVKPRHHGHHYATPNSTRTPAYVQKNKPSSQSNRADLHMHGHD